MLHPPGTLMHVVRSSVDLRSHSDEATLGRGQRRHSGRYATSPPRTNVGGFVNRLPGSLATLLLLLSTLEPPMVLVGTVVDGWPSMHSPAQSPSTPACPSPRDPPVVLAGSVLGGWPTGSHPHSLASGSLAPVCAGTSHDPCQPCALRLVPGSCAHQ
jgi:hypothetical protein